MSEVTQILRAIEEGKAEAADQLLPLLYDELRRLAAQKLAREPAGQTLDATGLVHEAYLRLVASPGAPGSAPREQHWDGRGHFFAAAAEAMRRILVENARRKWSLKRGGDRDREELDSASCVAPEPAEEVLALDEALNKFTESHPTHAQLVKLRYFAGLSMAEAADALGISSTTADRYWAYARAWLHHEISKGS